MAEGIGIKPANIVNKHYLAGRVCMLTVVIDAVSYELGEEDHWRTLGKEERPALLVMYILATTQTVRNKPPQKQSEQKASKKPVWNANCGKLS